MSDCRRERFKRRSANRTLHSSGSHDRTRKRRILRRERATRGTLPNEVKSVPECSTWDQLKDCSRQRIRILAIKFQRLYPRQPTVLKPWYIQERTNLVSKDHLSPSLPPKGCIQKCVTSSTRRPSSTRGQTCCRPYDEKIQIIFQSSRCTT